MALLDGEFVVQWREAGGGSGWTSPEPVVPGLARDADEITLDSGGSTVALGLTSYSVLDDEREGGGRTDAVACRPYDCEPLLGVTRPPEVTDDGQYAVALDDPEGSVAADDGAYDLARWDLGSGEWSPAQVTDPVPSDDAVRPELVLVGDGTLATVRSEPRADRDGCSFALWATEPRGTELERVATTDPVAGTSSCSFQSVGTDGKAVSFLVYDVERTVTFTRDDGRWAPGVPCGPRCSTTS